jgi:hypothetical protein
MSIAAEAFAEEQAIDGTDIKILLQRFGEYLETAGTQPVTIPISHIVEDMLETYKLASTKASEVHAFAWARSADLQATLEDFVRTRECLFYTDGCLPAVEASFGVPSRQSHDELTVEIHYTWNPPKVNFETFQNVFDENRSFHLEPRISQPCQDSETSYSVDQCVPIVNWNASEGCLEGYCPPLLASSVGAERLECFSMPLNMSAQVTTTFPGDMKLERTIRLEIPITIRRRPDACSSDQELDNSPTVRKPAVSVLVPSTDTTPQSAEPPRAGKDVEVEDFWTNYKEISALMDRKARGAAGKITPPMRLNPLSLAQLWDATAKRPLRMVTGSLGKSSSKAQKTTPSNTAQRAAEDHAENIVDEIVLTRQVLGALDYIPKHDSAVNGGIDHGDPGPSKKPCRTSSESRVDPPVVSPHEKASNKFTLSDEQAHFLAAKAARRNLARWKHDGVVSTLEQRAIQLAHQKDLEEMEKGREVDESLLVEGDEDSEESDF